MYVVSIYLHNTHNVYIRSLTHTQTLYCILYNCTLGRRTQGSRGIMVHRVAHTWFRTISIYYTAFDEGVVRIHCVAQHLTYTMIQSVAVKTSGAPHGEKKKKTRAQAS
jgi:hypothetical protein